MFCRSIAAFRRRRGAEATPGVTVQDNASSTAAAPASSSTQEAAPPAGRATEQNLASYGEEITSTKARAHDLVMPSDDEIAALKKDSDRIRKSLTSFFKELRDYKSSELVPSGRLFFTFFTRRLVLLTEIHSLVFEAARIKANEQVDDEWLSEAGVSVYELSDRLDCYNAIIASHGFCPSKNRNIKQGLESKPSEWAEINSSETRVIDLNKSFPIIKWEHVEKNPSTKESFINAVFAKMIWTDIHEGFEVYNMIQGGLGKDIPEWLTEKVRPSQKEVDKWNNYYQEVWFLE